MKNFTFKLQPVLDLRQRVEKDAANQLNSARTEQAIALLAQQAAERELNAGREEAALAATPAEGVAAGELHFYRTILDHLGDRSAESAGVVTLADLKVERTSQAYDHAVQERSMLDRLEERHRESWRQMALAGDRNAMDAVALTRHLMAGRAQ